MISVLIRGKQEDQSQRTRDNGHRGRSDVATSPGMQAKTLEKNRKWTLLEPPNGTELC